jgi:hypothetical protein
MIPNTVHSKSFHHHFHHHPTHCEAVPFTSPLIQGRETPQEMTWAFIPARVVVQILLVIILRIPPLTRGQDLSYNLSFPPLLIRLLRHLPRNSLLFRVMIEDSTPILGSGVRPLAVRSCRVMHFIEEFEELAVCNLRGVEGNLESFGI